MEKRVPAREAKKTFRDYHTLWSNNLKSEALQCSVVSKKIVMRYRHVSLTRTPLVYADSSSKGTH